MPHNPPDLCSSYDLPNITNLRKPEVVGRVLTKLIAVDAGTEKFYNTMLHHNIAARYHYALLLFNDRKAYAAFAREPRVIALARKLKDREDVCRALIMATVADPSKGSKIWKRVEHLWRGKKPASDVVRLLNRYGLEKAIPGVKLPRPHLPNDAEGDDGKLDGNVARQVVRRPHIRHMPDEEEPIERAAEGLTAVIHNAPPHYAASMGAQVTFDGTVLAVDDGKITIAVSALRKMSDSHS